MTNFKVLQVNVPSGKMTVHLETTDGKAATDLFRSFRKSSNKFYELEIFEGKIIMNSITV